MKVSILIIGILFLLGSAQAGVSLNDPGCSGKGPQLYAQQMSKSAPAKASDTKIITLPNGSKAQCSGWCGAGKKAVHCSDTVGCAGCVNCIRTVIGTTQR